MLPVRAEVRAETVAGDDDRVLLQAPAAGLLVTGEELQAGGVDDRVVDLRLGCAGGRGRFLRAAAAGGQQQDDQSERRKAMVTRTPAPVAPRASRAVSLSAYAVPAISR